MREIKFRAWDKEKKKMFNVLGMKWDPDGKFICGNDEWNGPEVWCPPESISKIIMQYTGLKDKNGKEIYEGDVVKVHSGHDAIGADFGISKYRVQWREGGACLDMMHEDYLESERQIGMTFDNGGVKSIEIIGNIHQNPELLNN